MNQKTLRICSFNEILAGTAVSVVAFPVALGAIQNFVFKPLRITCKYPTGTVLFGASSVILSGTFASYAFVASCLALQRLQPSLDKDSTKFELDLEVTNERMLMCGVGSFVVFKCLGGRTRCVVPSHLFYPGSFARMSVPATGKNYASLSLKKYLNVLGRKYGCHSCGRRRQKDFVADHMPPNKLVKFYQSQVFYPQCKSCSHRQGGALSPGSQLSFIQTHATTLRRYHVWLPLPLGLAFVKDIFKSEDD